MALADGNVPQGKIEVGEGDFGCLMSRSARLLHVAVRNQLHVQGLDNLDYVVLQTALGHWQNNQSAITAAQVAEKTVFPLEAVNRSIDRLLRHGYFVFRPIGAPEGLEPSAKALKLEASLEAETRWVFEMALNGFSFEEIDTLIAMLRRVYANLRP
jgi:hypothetical protein